MTHLRFLFPLMKMINGDVCASVITSLDVFSGSVLHTCPAGEEAK